MRVTKEEKQKLKDLAEKFGFDFEEEGRNCEVSVAFYGKDGDQSAYYSCSINCDEDGKRYEVCDWNYINDYLEIDSAISGFLILIKEDAFIDALAREKLFNIDYFRSIGGEAEYSYQEAIKTAIYFAAHEDVIRLLQTGRIDLEELKNWMDKIELEQKQATSPIVVEDMFDDEGRCKIIIDNWILKQKLTSELSVNDSQTKRLKI